ncbi:MAG: hypothetical protein A2275_12420 [Bacteroidetes bacterium RIFOXYA12_FULL_35_11]|nr:MAG: hypothetical protein A2X01_02475 [Bacteroidetes bacterium GWF2_35_48]OFY77883.1 MAG: hypothetical protein A2275_12420 [Bacteroidetes bacterium RIFOXYA12_FULL_35_11]OFY96029.1 MAG: hypothetical protein A2491_06020 [Bacteroidetes bacterium RIFOXYC12_FULL_35_7]HBX50355.1 hypothetical protein [Bacteroidales bacterium]
MTVSELIQKLQTMPPHALVVSEGYEDGYDAVKKVSLISVAENPKKEWYVGKYIDSKKADALEVVFLNAENKTDK